MLGSIDVESGGVSEIHGSVEDGAVSSRSDDAACLPSRSGANGFSIQPTNSRRVAWCAERGSRGVEYFGIFVTLLVVGQSERRGVRSDDGFCS